MKALKLCLHCGGEETDLATIAKVRTPAATDTWTPLPHDAFIEQVRKGLGSANLEVVAESHALAKGGDRYFGMMQIGRGGMNANDHALVLGLRNAHDKRFPAGLVAGAGVFVCDNLSFSGEVREFRKHTVNIFRDLPGKIVKAIGELNGLWVNQEKRFDAYRETVLDRPALVHDLLVRAVDAKAMPVTYLPHVLNEWRNPSHEEFKARNVWGLFNAATEVFKRTNIHELPARTQALHLLLDEQCGIAVEKAGNN
jgi:hypothetical protein